MKKKYLLFYCILFTIILSAQNTLQGKVFYTVSLKPFTEQQVDSLFKKQNTNKAAQTYVRKMLMNTKDVVGVLKFSKNESLYQLEDKMKNESKKRLNMTSMLAGSKSIYYVNSIKKDYLKQLSYNDFLRVDLPEIKWTITQETKKIGEYQCYKAVTFKKVRDDKPFIKTTVWFTPLIPVSFGPIDYFGLPGLILEVSYNRINIRATKIALNPKEKIVIKKPTKGKRMTTKEYKEMSRNFFKNLRK